MNTHLLSLVFPDDAPNDTVVPWRAGMVFEAPCPECGASAVYQARHQWGAVIGACVNGEDCEWSGLMGGKKITG